MPEMTSLGNITKSSFRAFRKHRALWWFAIPAGVFIGAGTFASQEFRGILPENPDITPWLALLGEQKFFDAFGLSLFAMLGQATIRGPLIALFAHAFQEKQVVGERKAFRWFDMLRAGRISIAFESAYWLALLLIGFALLLPVFLAQRFNPSVVPLILELGLLLLLVLGTYLYFVKELACLYALLGKVGLRSGIDLGFRLFRRQTFNTVLFFLYAGLLALFFGLFVEIIFRSVGFSAQGHSLKWFIVAALPFGLYFVFDQILRVTFFRSIASTPKQPVAEKVVLETTQTPSGIAPN